MANRFFSYHNTACKLITSYRKEMPLQHYLKQYFSENKKHGSKDRKWISHFCYSFYRLGKALPNTGLEERLSVAVYLCTEDLEILGDYLPENWLRTNVLDEKVQYAKSEFGFELEDIFPFSELLMTEVDVTEWNKGFLRQPNVFLRIRPGKAQAVTSILERSNIAFEKIGNSAIGLKNRIAIDQLLTINKDVVIQDLSSQAIVGLFPDDHIRSIWDCCAASGGKTILARDQYPNADITVSDLRPSILSNHKKRMQEAGVKIKQSFAQDLTQPRTGFKEQFDLIICDVPCSGSGTWARTPEEMYFFEKEMLKSVHELQLTIVRHIFDKLKENGYLLYITCSLFKEEDESVIQKVMETLPLSIIKKELLIGIGRGADSLFGCLLKKHKI